MPLPFLIKSPEKLHQKQRRCCIHNVMLLQHLGRDNDQNCKYQRKSLIPFRHLLRTFHTFPAHPAHIAVDRGKQIRRTAPAIQRIYQSENLFRKGISCDLRSYIGGRYLNKADKANKMYRQICGNKPVKHILTTPCRQQIPHRPEWKCQNIKPHKYRQ